MLHERMAIRTLLPKRPPEDLYEPHAREIAQAVLPQPEPCCADQEASTTPVKATRVWIYTSHSRVTKGQVERACGTCGVALYILPSRVRQQNYCSRMCASTGHQKAVISRSAGRDRARRWYALGDCQRCGKPASERHHRDGDTANNSPANVRLLCRRCHMTEDGRLTQLTNRPKQATPRPCAGCGKTREIVGWSLCKSCYYRQWRAQRRAAISEAAHV